MGSIDHWVVDSLALVWFLVCWVGYTRYAKKRSASDVCLASVMHIYRREWMTQMLYRDSRVADIAAISTLERSVTFFASSALLILAGVLTLLGYIDHAISLFRDLPLTGEQTRLQWEMKVFLLIVIFVYAFFKFTWSLRQVGFATVLMGAAPVFETHTVGDEEIKRTSERLARVISMAAHQFNFGIRSYYFALAVLAWLVSDWLFIAATGLVVFVLYRREFHSSALSTLMATPR